MSRNVQQQIPHTGLKDGRDRDDNVTAKATPVPSLCRGKRDDNLLRGFECDGQDATLKGWRYTFWTLEAGSWRLEGQGKAHV
jgi:hypothetical protein